MTVRWFLGLGSNLGDRLATLRGAARSLADLPGFEFVAVSRVWSTRPLGPGSGPFLNAALELRSDRDPDPEWLLAAGLAIERAHGRVRRERWGDRTLDIDLLCAYVDGRELIWTSPGLSLPHTGVLTRDFVLRPLLELDAELVVSGRRIAEAIGSVAEPTLIDTPAIALVLTES